MAAEPARDHEADEAVEGAHVTPDETPLAEHPGPSSYFRRAPHPVRVTIRDNKDYIRVLFYSYSTTITGWGVLLNHTDDDRGFTKTRGPRWEFRQ